MWTTALQFIQAPHDTNDNSTDTSQTNLLATGTAYKQVQIYDIRTSTTTRRPVLHTPESLLQHRVTSLLQLPNPSQLIVADAIGDCHILDMRKFHTGKQASYKSQKSRHAAQEIGVGRLVGPGGSIRQLAMHPTLPLVACVGLDRKLWTWDVNSRRMVDCIYLRQRLNCLLICEDGGWNGRVEESGEGMVEDGELEEGNEDEVEDYVDSSDDEVDGDDEMEAVNGSSSDDTESESGEETGSSEEEAQVDGSSSDEEEEVVESPPQKKSEQSNPKKKQKR